MKKLVLLLLFILPVLLTGQEDDNSYYQLRSIRLSPNPAHMAKLADNMRAHNMKYHVQGTYQAVVFNISTGPDAGDLIWMMGPTTFSEFDGRPGKGGHDKDWSDTVVPYLKDASHGEFWRRDDELSVNIPEEGSPPMNIYWIRYYNVEDGQGYRVDGLMKKIGETIATFEDKPYWAVYSNMFIQGNAGRHLAGVSGMDSWAELDRDRQFAKAFDKVHGEGAFEDWLKEMDEVFSDVWDEYWTVNHYMSGFPMDEK